ncbi:hypothetical protein [Embleya sp. NBC_00896]|uniref:hypothetical protein n=1 Tax=Embleya sp. NBC_00896 TaxID=2975961 RepID=UPI002F916F53|nr:hypothetical protein OG928_34715 [Embleya sp. NBC_00896]
MSLSPSGNRRARTAVAAAVLLFGVNACKSDGSTLPHSSRTRVPPAGPALPFARTVDPLTQEQARRSILALEDLGPGWSAGALKDGVPDPGDDDFPTLTGDSACDRALKGAPSGQSRITVGAEREFEQDRTTLKLVVSAQVHAGNGAVVHLAQTRAMVEGCADVEIPMRDGVTARYRAIAAPAVADEALGMRIVMSTGGAPGSDTITGETMTVRLGPNTVTILVVGAGLDPNVLDRITRRAAERLQAAARE